MSRKRDNWTDWAAAAAFGAVLSFALILGQKDRSLQNRNQSGYEAEEAVRAGEKASLNSGKEAENRKEDALPEADDSQRRLLGQLMEYLEEGDMEKAARLADQVEEQLDHLFYGVMKGERYLYDGEVFLKDQTEGQPSLSGEGLVLTMAKTMFFGRFEHGKPEGEALAFQVVDLEAPRYEYAQGIWKDGKLEGAGRTGYCYYEKVPQGEPRKAERKGRFAGDQMEGEVEYRTESEEGKKTTWRFETEHGIIQLDDRWAHRPEKGEYQLMSEKDENHAYILEESVAGQPIWVNPLLWEG